MLAAMRDILFFKKINLIEWLSERIQNFRERTVVFAFTSMWMKVGVAFAGYPVLPTVPQQLHDSGKKCLQHSPRVQPLLPVMAFVVVVL